MNAPADRAADEASGRAARGGVAFEDVVERPVAFSPKPRTMVVVDRRLREMGRPLHIWALGAAIVGLAAFFALSTVSSLRGTGPVLSVVSVAVGLGLVMLKGRPRTEREDVPLLWMNASLGMLRVRESGAQRSLAPSSNIGFDEVHEVLYALREVPAAGGRAQVEGAAVFVRLRDGVVWPIIPATLAKREAYQIALGVAQRIGVGVKQVGAGWRTDDPA